MINKFYITFLILFLLFGAFSPIASFDVTEAGADEVTGPPRVLVIDVEGEIRAGTTQFVKRSLRKAEVGGFNLLLIRINTPGGLLKATEEISRLLLDSNVKTVVFVHKSGGWAFSAGTFILLSAEVSASHPNASIGAAQPRVLGMGDAAEPDEKIIGASSVWIKSLAEVRGHDPVVAEKFVRENLTLSGQEAYEKNVVNFIASSTDELLGKLGLENAIIEEVSPNLLERVLSFLSISYLVPLLLGIGSLGLFFVFRTGEFEVGIFAVIALLLGLWGMGAINLSVMGSVFLILGIILILVEVFVAPGLGIFGITGTFAFLFGVLTFAEEPFLPGVLTQPTFWLAAGAALAVSVFFIILSRLLIKTLRSKAKAGSDALMGDTAVVTEKLSPYGRVEINNESWVAKEISGKGVIRVKEKVRVVKIQGNTLIVETVENE